MKPDVSNFQKIRDLTLSQSEPGKAHHLSAASGMVKVGNTAFVVADDELHLAVFKLDTNEPGSMHRLLPGDLPNEPGELASTKPDFESLIYLPPDCVPPRGALLAVPSGADPSKCRGSMVSFDSNGLLEEAKAIDFTNLYKQLATTFDALRIEGAVCGDGEIILFQRGNGESTTNAAIKLHGERFNDCLRFFSSVESICLEKIVPYDLGDIDGVRLGFTDAAPLANGSIVFTAAAESHTNGERGEHKGFAMGIMERDGTIGSLKTIKNGPRVEGIFAEQNEKVLLWLVIDNSDPKGPSAIFTVPLF